jgi:hypothetical protein
MTDQQPSPAPGRRRWILVVLLVASLLPLLFLKLDAAGQLASALALPLSVLLAALPMIPPIRRRASPFPWRRYLVYAAIAIALIGLTGVGYAVWQNTKDIALPLPQGGPTDVWRDLSSTTVDIPEVPPQRDHVLFVVSLNNINSFGNCERPATLEFTPVIDGRDRSPVWARPGDDAEVPIAEATQKASVRLTLHYDPGNTNCEVHLYINKAVLHD